MKTKLNNQNRGFTIIEVMIVLTIAGLILLIVFLAVPALQRNARNTQRKNDVSALLAGVNEYESNNGGQLPNALPTGTTTITFNNGTTAQANVGFYTGGVGAGAGQITETVAPAFPVAALPATAAGDRVVILNGGACTAVGGAVQGSTRQVAILYEIENGGSSFAAVCTSS